MYSQHSAPRFSKPWGQWPCEIFQHQVEMRVLVNIGKERKGGGEDENVDGRQAHSRPNELRSLASQGLQA